MPDNTAVSDSRMREALLECVPSPAVWACMFPKLAPSADYLEYLRKMEQSILARSTVPSHRNVLLIPLGDPDDYFKSAQRMWSETDNPHFPPIYRASLANRVRQKLDDTYLLWGEGAVISTGLALACGAFRFDDFNVLPTSASMIRRQVMELVQNNSLFELTVWTRLPDIQLGVSMTIQILYRDQLRAVGPPMALIAAVWMMERAAASHIGGIRCRANIVQDWGWDAGVRYYDQQELISTAGLRISTYRQRREE